MEIMKLIPDSIYLKIQFRKKFGRKLNLKNPLTFNEKMQWLKLYDRNPKYTVLVDKYEVKKIVSQVLGKQYIIPTIGVWDKFDDIDFDDLPNQFVLKCTHDSGGLVICLNKKSLKRNEYKEKIEKCLKNNFYYLGREWPYKNVKPRIIAEPLMSNSNDNKNLKNELTDYKFMSFNGKVKCLFVCTERFSADGLKVNFFDRDWNALPFERYYPRSLKIINKPVNYNEMIMFAEKLSENIPFVRVDFYEIDNKIYFGEITFYPGSGMEEFKPSEWDRKLGDWIQLPIKKGEKVWRII